VSTLSDLQWAQTLIHDSATYRMQLLLAVSTAAVLPGPSGSPTLIHTRSKTYRGTAAQIQAIGSNDLTTIARAALPAAWRGQASESAADAVDAIRQKMYTVNNIYDVMGKTLETWSVALAAAQHKDHDGCDALRTARLRLTAGSSPGMPDTDTIMLAINGIADRVHAAQQSADAATNAAAILNEGAAQARARQVGDALDPMSAIVLDGDLPVMLGSVSLTQGAQRLLALSPDDRKAFENLLSSCASPIEAGYLWKALAAGYSVADIDAFDQAIRPHGSDPGWLGQHLSPDLANGEYQGQSIYGQGNVGDCVAASTVMARANLDPVSMLKLTTGYGQPAGSKPPPGDDSPDAVAHRVQDAFLALDNNGYGGGHSTELANGQLDGPTGATYVFHELSGADAAARKALLPQIEGALDAGKPVVIGVAGTVPDTPVVIPGHRPEIGPPGVAIHEMVIIGHQPGSLQIYNPWGFSKVVPESDFIDGQLGSLTDATGRPDGGLPRPISVTLPQ
jgi:uncharacterized protein YukE